MNRIRALAAKTTKPADDRKEAKKVRRTKKIVQHEEARIEFEPKCVQSS